MQIQSYTLFFSYIRVKVKWYLLPKSLISYHSQCRKLPTPVWAEYGPHRDALSLCEARSGSNAANYAAKEPAGFKGPRQVLLYRQP